MNQDACAICSSYWCSGGPECAVRARAHRLVKLEEEVRDLKARLKAVRERLPKPSSPEDLDEIERELWALTDLRRKNWRKP